jgi:hypothetical protein
MWAFLTFEQCGTSPHSYSLTVLGAPSSEKHRSVHLLPAINRHVPMLHLSFFTKPRIQRLQKKGIINQNKDERVS